MDNRTESRLASAVIFSSVVSIRFCRDYLKRGLLGKEDFLVKQSIRFDKYFAHPDVIKTLITGLAFTLALIGAYELLALGIEKIMCREK